MEFDIILILDAFKDAGFIGLLVETVKDRNPKFTKFFSYGFKYCLDFIFFNIFILLENIGIRWLFANIDFFSSIILNIIFFIIFIFIIFCQFTIIYDDVIVFKALYRSIRYFTRRTEYTMQVVVSIIILNFFSAYIINLFGSLTLFIIAIILYNYLMTGLLISLLISLVFLKDKKLSIY